MQFDEIINAITPEAYQTLKRAVELGKWPDGVRLSKEQREQCMQAVIAYDARNLSEEERIGQINRGTKEEGEVCESHEHEHDLEHERNGKQVNNQLDEETSPVKFIK